MKLFVKNKKEIDVRNERRKFLKKLFSKNTPHAEILRSVIEGAAVGTFLGMHLPMFQIFKKEDELLKNLKKNVKTAIY